MVVMVEGIILLAVFVLCVFFFQAEDGIRDLVRSRGLGDVYKRQGLSVETGSELLVQPQGRLRGTMPETRGRAVLRRACLLYTSDAADERSSVDLGGRRIIKKKTYRCSSKSQPSQQNATYTQEARMKTLNRIVPENS